MKTATSALLALATAPIALATAPIALATAPIALAPPDQGPACGWWQMWSPGVDVCGPETREFNFDDPESYLTQNGPMTLDDICGKMVALSWGDGAPVLDGVDVGGGTSWSIAAQNIEGVSHECDYSGTDCGNAGPIFSRWFWPDLPMC